jgi:hypothetical protein
VANGTFGPGAFSDTLPLLLAFAAFMVVGALIVAHRPGNVIGWPRGGGPGPGTRPSP